MHLVDTHCHLDDPRFDADRAEVLARAAGMTIVVPGVHEAQWPRLRAQAASWGVAFAVGTHPQCLPESRAVPTDVAGACAIGECGLDHAVPVPMDEQARVLAAHVALAVDTKLPLILHCYRAHPTMLAVLRRFGPLRGVMHSYSGGPELVADYLQIGLHISLAGVVTYDNARKPLNTLRRVPRERLLAETDAPDQCPRPHRGRNEPSFLPYVIAAMEAARGEPLADLLTANAVELFGLQGSRRPPAG